MKKIFWMVIVLILAAIIYFVARGDGNSNSNNVSATDTPGASIEPAVTENADTRVFKLTARNFSFAPNVIEVNEGDTVKIILESAQGFHDFVVDGYDASTTRVNTDETAEIVFKADKKGSFEFYCSVGNHRAMGMVGTLKVN